MSDISKQNPLDIAAQAEQDLNSYEAKTGHQSHYGGQNPKGTASDSTLESGVNDAAAAKFANAGANVTYGSEVTGRTIDPSQGGNLVKETGKMTKDKDFEGVGGPEDKIRQAQEDRGGDQSVPGNAQAGGQGYGTKQQP